MLTHNFAPTVADGYDLSFLDVLDIFALEPKIRASRVISDSPFTNLDLVAVESLDSAVNSFDHFAVDVVAVDAWPDTFDSRKHWFLLHKAHFTDL